MTPLTVLKKLASQKHRQSIILAKPSIDKQLELIETAEKLGFQMKNATDTHFHFERKSRINKKQNE